MARLVVKPIAEETYTLKLFGTKGQLIWEARDFDEPSAHRQRIDREGQSEESARGEAFEVLQEGGTREAMTISLRLASFTFEAAEKRARLLKHFIPYAVLEGMCIRVMDLSHEGLVVWLMETSK